MYRYYILIAMVDDIPSIGRIIRIEQASLTGIGENEVSRKEGLMEIFPNPLTKSATLRFELDNQESVGIELHDISGRKVLMVYEERSLSPGQHEFPLNFRLPSGTYFLNVDC